MTRPGGTIVIAGTRGFGTGTPGFEPTCRLKEIRISGALGVDAASYEAGVELLASGKYPFAVIPRQVAHARRRGGPHPHHGRRSSAPPPVHGVLVP